MDFEVELAGGAPWGFRIQGGREFHSPIRITFLKAGGKASASKQLKVGDTVLEINETATASLTHTQAEQLIKRAGRQLNLSIHRKDSPKIPDSPPVPNRPTKENSTPDNVENRPVNDRRKSDTDHAIPDKEKDPDWYRSMFNIVHQVAPADKPGAAPVRKKASVYEMEVEKMNQYNAERSRPLQRADSKSIAEGVRRSQSPGTRNPPAAPKRNKTNGCRQSSPSPGRPAVAKVSAPAPARPAAPDKAAPRKQLYSPHAGKKGIGFKPGGYSLAAGVKGARNISEAPLMHVSNLDHHERVSSYDSVESNTSNASYGGRSSDLSTPPSSSPNFVGPISTKPVTPPQFNNKPPPKHSLHIDSSSRDKSSYNSKEVASMLRQSYTNRNAAALSGTNMLETMDFTKEFTNSKVIPMERLKDEGITEGDSQNLESKISNILQASSSTESRDVTPRDLPTRDVTPRDLATRDVTTRDLSPRDKSPKVRGTSPVAPAREEPRYCKARYTFKAEGDRELSFKKKDLIRVRREVDSNWIEGELDGVVGIFPRNYVDMMEPPPPQESQPEIKPEELETTFEPKSFSGSNMNYVPRYQRDIQSLPKSRYRKDNDPEKENKEAQLRKAVDDRIKQEEEEERRRKEEWEERRREEERTRLEEETKREEEIRCEQERIRREEDRMREEERILQEEERRREEERLRLEEEGRREEERMREQERIRLEEERRREEKRAREQRQLEEERKRLEMLRAREEEERRENERRETERRESERRETEIRESERRESERRETKRRESERRESERRETERRETEKREFERREAENREAQRRESEKREAEIRESERRESERRETERREAERRNEEARLWAEEERLRKEEDLRREEEEIRAREEEDRLREERRLREEERLRELENLHEEEIRLAEEDRRRKEEEEERARVDEQNNINYRVSNSDNVHVVELNSDESDAFDVKAVYTFKSVADGELSFKKGTVITVTEIVDDNWYFGKIGSRDGMFPASYVVRDEEDPIQRIEDCSGYLDSSALDTPVKESDPDTTPFLDNSRVTNTEDDSSDFQDSYELHLAQYSYEPKNSDELELIRGDVVEVIEKCDDGWFVGTSQRTDLFGTFPGNYVILYEDA